MDAAFFVDVGVHGVEPAPASGAGVFVGERRRGTNGAPDTGETFVVEAVVGYVVLVDVGFYFCGVPIGQRGELDDGAPFVDVEFGFGRVASGIAVVLAQAGDPYVDCFECFDIGFDFPDLAAEFLFGLTVEKEKFAVLVDHLIETRRIGFEVFDVDAVACFDFVHERIGFGMKAEGVDREDAEVWCDFAGHIDHDAAGVLEAGDDTGALAEICGGPTEQFFGTHLVEFFQKAGVLLLYGLKYGAHRVHLGSANPSIPASATIARNASRPFAWDQSPKGSFSLRSFFHVPNQTPKTGASWSVATDS